MPVALYIQAADVDRAKLLQGIRDSDYVQELVSGEEDGDFSIQQLVQMPEATTQSVAEAEEHVQTLDASYSRQVLLIADGQTKEDGSVLVVQLSPSNTMRVAQGSVLEVVARLDAGESTLDTFRALSGNGIYDAGQ